MSRWTISPGRLFVLGFAVFVILLLVVLPQVDPLDTAFHRGTAPAAVHARATSIQAVLSLVVPFLFLQTPEDRPLLRDQSPFALFSSPNFLPILHHSLRR